MNNLELQKMLYFFINYFYCHNSVTLASLLLRLFKNKTKTFLMYNIPKILSVKQILEKKSMF